MKKWLFISVFYLFIPVNAIAQILDGVWESGGELLVITNGTWMLQENGYITDRGTYVQNGNVITSKSNVNGQDRKFLFQRYGNKLILKESNGAIYRYDLYGSGAGTGSRCAGMSFEECLVNMGVMPPSVNIWE